MKITVSGLDYSLYFLSRFPLVLSAKVLFNKIDLICYSSMCLKNVDTINIMPTVLTSDSPASKGAVLDSWLPQTVVCHVTLISAASAERVCR